MKTTIKLTESAKQSYKIGIDEIVGLKDAMVKLMAPIKAAVKDNVYWDDCEVTTSEYKSRDGFIPYSSNCGGLELTVIIPQCESHSFNYLDFGEWDGEHYCNGEDKDNCECHHDDDGHYDAKLRVWLKFEGLDNGELKFYLYMGGGNSDAPYFRTKHEATVFEREFKCASVDGLIKASHPHVKALIKIIMKG